VKLCTVCGVVTSRAGSRCTEHARESNRSRHNALYATRTWQRLSARVLRAWRGEQGDWCPGYQRPAHPARDLTVDHVIPLAAGGVSSSTSQSGRGEGHCPATTDLPITMRLAEPPEPFDWLRSA
jgi:5-methylcytosine-specific restriction protein A